MLDGLDAWLLARVFQPVVDWAAVRLGVTSYWLALQMLFARVVCGVLFLSLRLQNGNPPNLFFWGLGLFVFGWLLHDARRADASFRSNPRSLPRTAIRPRTRRLILGFSGVGGFATFSVGYWYDGAAIACDGLAGDIAFVAYAYLMGCLPRPPAPREARALSGSPAAVGSRS